jgi:hypothetical protein
MPEQAILLNAIANRAYGCAPVGIEKASRAPIPWTLSSTSPAASFSIRSSQNDFGLFWGRASIAAKQRVNLVLIKSTRPYVAI